MLTNKVKLLPFKALGLSPKKDKGGLCGKRDYLNKEWIDQGDIYFPISKTNFSEPTSM